MSTAAVRLERAEVLANSAEFDRGASGAYYVQSGTNHDVFYQVKLEGGGITCTCPSFAKRHEPCKHAIALSIKLAAQAQR